MLKYVWKLTEICKLKCYVNPCGFDHSTNIRIKKYIIRNNYMIFDLYFPSFLTFLGCQKRRDRNEREKK